jgi:integrase
MGRNWEYRVDCGLESVGFSLPVRDGVYYLKAKLPDGRVIRQTTGEQALNRAKDYAIVRIKFLVNPVARQEELTWEEVLEEVTKAMKSDNAKESTIVNARSVLNLVKTAAVTPKAVSPSLAQLWYNQYKAGHFSRGKRGGTYSRSNRTHISTLKKIRSLWGKWLVKVLKVTATNPWEQVVMPKLQKVRVRRLEDSDLDAFIEYVSGRFGDWWLPLTFFDIKCISGCRLMDLCAAKSADLKGDVLTLHHTKTGEPRYITLPPETAEALNRHKGKEWLWNEYTTAKFKTGRKSRQRDFSPKRFAGFVVRIVKRFKAKTGLTVRTHDFRKRFVTKSFEAGHDPVWIAAVCGMTLDNLLRNYLGIKKQQTQTEGTAKLAPLLLPDSRKKS